MVRLGASRINIERNIQEDEQSIKKTDKWLFYMLILAIGIIPLLIGVHTKLFASPVISGTGVIQTGYQSDLLHILNLLL